jgi:hypothetical protein
MAKINSQIGCFGPDFPAAPRVATQTYACKGAGLALRPERIDNSLAAILFLDERGLAEEISLAGRFAISSGTIRAVFNEPLPAAQYVRMSDKHQRHSTENQSDTTPSAATSTSSEPARPAPSNLN